MKKTGKKLLVDQDYTLPAGEGLQQAVTFGRKEGLSLSGSGGPLSLTQTSSAALLNLPLSNNDYAAIFQQPAGRDDSDGEAAGGYSSYGSSSEEDEKLEHKVKEVNAQMGISYNKRGYNIIKRLVSRNKRRYVQDGFDLDLSYITPRIIAMGFPSERLEAVYRNSMRDVQEFFRKKHAGFYKVYNLCTERSYTSAKQFEKCSQAFRFEDHNPPPFDMIHRFCEDVDAWMRQDERNVAAIHCKAGKGRTGVMICCYLVYAQLFKSAKEALVFYGKIRTSNGKGVTIPSQIRYVYYYDEFLKLRRREFPQRVLSEMPRKVVKIYKIRIISIPSIQGGGFEPLFRVKYPRGDHVIYDSKWEEGPGGSGKTKFLQDELSYYDFRIKSRSLLVEGDVKVEFFHVNSVPPHKREKAFHFWFNTGFLDHSGVLSMDKPMIEKADKDKKCARFDQNFRIEVYTSQIHNYRLELREFEKGVRLEVPVETFTQDQLRLLEIAEKLPKLQRKISL